MTSMQVIEKVLKEEYEDQCRHQKSRLVIPYGAGDCEGYGIRVECVQCNQVLEEGVVYE